MSFIYPPTPSLFTVTMNVARWAAGWMNWKSKCCQWAVQINEFVSCTLFCIQSGSDKDSDTCSQNDRTLCIWCCSHTSLSSILRHFPCLSPTLKQTSTIIMIPWVQRERERLRGFRQMHHNFVFFICIILFIKISCPKMGCHHRRCAGWVSV